MKKKSGNEKLGREGRGGVNRVLNCAQEDVGWIKDGVRRRRRNRKKPSMEQQCWRCWINKISNSLASFCVLRQILLTRLRSAAIAQVPNGAGCLGVRRRMTL
eukprot:467868-Hanusia_phi.AAC.1